jgi:hypothetical protein
MNLELDKFGFIVESGLSDHSETANEYIPLLEAQRQEYAKTIEKMNQDVDAVNRNPGYNPRGKLEKTSAIKSKAFDGLKQLTETRQKKLVQAISIAEKDLPKTLPVAVGSVPVLDYLRQQEIRQILANINSMERPQAIKNAAAKGDLDTLQAVCLAPKLLNLADENTIAEATGLFLKQANPEKYKKLDELHEVRTYFTQNHQRAIQLTGSHREDVPVNMQ